MLGFSLLPADFSLVVASEGSSLVAACRLLVAVASLVAEHGRQSAGSVCVAHGLSCPVWHVDRESNPCPLHWQEDSSPLDQQEDPTNFSVSFSPMFT